MNDTDTKAQLPVHLIFGASEYAKIKTNIPAKIGTPGKPIAELTRFGWTIMSPGKECFKPHKPVVRPRAESTKMRVVYDASDRAYDGAPSLNDCLHTGHSLQNKLWNVLVRGRFYPVALSGDLQKAFLQVRIKADSRYPPPSTAGSN